LTKATPSLDQNVNPALLQALMLCPESCVPYLGVF
jgi:hypothetical protein